MSESEQMRAELQETLNKLRSRCEEKRGIWIETDYEDLCVYMDSALFYLELNEFANCVKEIQYAIDLVKKCEEDVGPQI